MGKLATERMIFIRLLGGLGNQLFIYAFGRALELEHNLDVYFDTFSGFKKDTYKRKYELDNFNVKIKKAALYDSLFYPINKRSKKIKNILYPESILIEEDNKFSVKELILNAEKYKKVFLQGYFQKQEYFENIKEELRKEITLKTEFSVIAKRYLERINSCNSVILHTKNKFIKTIIKFTSIFYFFR
jgi:hypothetical protein